VASGTRFSWEIDEHAWLFIEPSASHAGAGRITFGVDGLNALLEGLAAQRLHRPEPKLRVADRVPNPRTPFGEPPLRSTSRPMTLHGPRRLNR
jgi:hypothetical protein